MSSAGFYAWRDRPLSLRAVRHSWLTDLITEIHTDSRQTYGSPRVHAELTLGRGIVVGRHTIAALMCQPGLQGLPASKRLRGMADVAAGTDLVDRHFAREGPNELWVTDIEVTPLSGHPDHYTGSPQYHRAPDPRGQAVLRRRHRRVLTAGCRLVDRLVTDLDGGDECAGYGDPEP